MPSANFATKEVDLESCLSKSSIPIHAPFTKEYAGILGIFIARVDSGKVIMWAETAH